MNALQVVLGNKDRQPTLQTRDCSSDNIGKLLRY